MAAASRPLPASMPGLALILVMSRLRGWRSSIPRPDRDVLALFILFAVALVLGGVRRRPRPAGSAPVPARPAHPEPRVHPPRPRVPRRPVVPRTDAVPGHTVVGRDASFAEAAASCSESARLIRETLSRPSDLDVVASDRRRVTDLVVRLADFAPGPSAAALVPHEPDPRRRARFGLRHLTAIAVLALLAGLATEVAPRFLSPDIPVAGPRAPVPSPRTAPVSPPMAPVAALRPKLDVAPVGADRPALASPSEPFRLQPPYEITDGLTFGPEGALKTRLAGLDGPGRDAVCIDRDSRPWACGLQARAALNNITRKASFACSPAGASRTDVVVANCTADDVNVAREIVLAGFARVTGSDPVLRLAEEEARENGRGLWNGGWTIRLTPR